MIKKLASCIRQYKRDSILAPLFIVGEGFMEVVIPLFMARLIDNGIDKGSMPAILRYGQILAVCCMISLGFGALAARFAAKASGNALSSPNIRRQAPLLRFTRTIRTEALSAQSAKKHRASKALLHM